MKKRILLLAITLFAFPGIASAAEDEEINIVASATYAYKSLDFEVGNKRFKPKFTTLDWAITAAYKKAFVKINFDQSIKDHNQVNNTLDGSGAFDNTRTTLSREDSGLTIGYSVLNNVSIFGGYKYGKTSGVDTGQIKQVTFTGPPGGTRFYTDNSSISFTEDGPFLGVSYSHLLKKSGTVNFSFAYANLDGESSFNRVEPDPVTGDLTVFINDTSTGDSTGISYSISYTDKLVESINFTIALKSTRYEFDGPSPPVVTDETDFDEIYNIFSIGFSKYF